MAGVVVVAAEKECVGRLDFRLVISEKKGIGVPRSRPPSVHASGCSAAWISPFSPIFLLVFGHAHQGGDTFK